MTDALPSFISYLTHKKLITSDIEESFDTRFRIQKYVFLAKFYGLDMHYAYSLYVRGPYSPELTQAYYKITEDKAIPDKPVLSESFKSEEFLKLVEGRDNEWLEIAATMMKLENLYGRQHGSTSLISKTHRVKYGFEYNFVADVFDNLKKMGLLSETRIDTA